MKRYPAYKDSGIEWIGEIPEHWELHKVVSHIALINGYPFNSEYFNQYEGTPLVRIRDITSGKTENYYLGEFPEESIIDNGDILIGMDGDFLVRWWEGGRALLNQRCCCLRTKETINKRYLFYLLQYPLDIINDLTYFTTVKHISSAQIVRIKYPYPSTTEQQSIANYLDRKTHLIDTLIENKQNLIDLLKEQRTAIINQAVTKGLNPNVKLKDSGIEWLGVIPEHWDVKPLKYTVKINQHSLPENTHEDYEIQYIDIGNVNQDGLVNPPKVMSFGISPSRARRVVKKGDTIVSTVRTYLKAIGYIDSVDGNLIASTGFAVLTSTNKMHSMYLYYLISTQKIIDTISSLSVGVSYPAINSSEFGSIPIWFPKSIDEQKTILNFIEGKVVGIRNLINKTAKKIELLKEYRTALISEVVTGKIEVRDSGIPEVRPS